MNFPRINWMIYESDILHIGGTVEYSGCIHAKSWRSTVREAEISINSLNISVLMECFRDGTAVVMTFLHDGKPLSKNNIAVEHFLDILQNAKENEPLFEEFLFFRQLKQVSIGMLQCICFYIFVINMFQYISLFYVPNLLISLLALFIFLLLGIFYSKIRTTDFSKHKTFLYN